jgi:hypothetical protein
MKTRLQEIMGNIFELGTLEQTLLMIALVGVAWSVGAFFGKRASNKLDECKQITNYKNYGK